jgi:uncharacterized membrane protein/thiol-disulfide isomerase/thioredoxin
MRRAIRVLTLVALLALVIAAPAAAAPPPQAGAVVRAVFFYSPTCGHCQYVITEVFPPLFEEYGDQLEIIGVDVTNPAAQNLFSAAVDFYDIPEDARGAVPYLVIGDTFLIGDVDILEQFPGIIEDGLAQGGIDWPEIPGLAEVLASVPPADGSSAATPTATTTPIPLTLEPRTVASTFMNDPVGNSIAVVVLVGMIASAVVVGLRLRNPKPHQLSTRAHLGVVLLSLAGIAISAYMTFIETSGTPAVCGPVGDCNTVQQSQFALLFGVIPLGALGLVGYAAILLTWLGARWLPGRRAEWSTVFAFGLSAFGTLFSIVLTFLEPFVIGATCTWCISSALAMTGLLWLTSGPGIAALQHLEEDDSAPETPQEPGAA